MLNDTDLLARTTLNSYNRQGMEIVLRVHFKNETKTGMLVRFDTESDLYEVLIGNDVYKLYEAVNSFDILTGYEEIKALEEMKANTKNNDKKVETKMEKMTTLKNGVKFYDMIVDNDIFEAQEILDINEYTQNIDAENAYNERVEFSGIGSYVVKVARTNDFQRFMRHLKDDLHCVIKNNLLDEVYEKKRAWKRKVQRFYSRGFYPNVEIAGKFYDKLNNLQPEKCTCNKCSFRLPTMQEWLTGKYQETEKRQQKLGKYMRKIGVSQEVIDFYSQQVKTEREVVLTVSPYAQHVAGMSYYCEAGSWNGFNGTSCQDVRHSREDYPMRLGGSLHDNKLFMGMLHNSVEDLEDFNDKMLARVIFRYITIDGVGCLVATQYYGNNETKDLLHNAVSALEEVNIFSTKYNEEGNREWHKERTNGFYEHVIVEDVHIEETIEEEKRCSCPLCGGNGEHEVYSDRAERWVEVTCPNCGGDGNVYYTFYNEIDEWIEVESTSFISPYNEGYRFGDRENGNTFYMEMYLDIDAIKEVLESNGYTVSK